MDILEREIPKLITPEAQGEMVNWLSHVPGVGSWATIIKNPLAYYSDLAPKIIADRESGHSRKPLPSSLLRIQVQWDCVFEIRNYLQNFHGFTSGPHLPWREIDQVDQWYLREVHRETASTNWVLNERKQAGCYWCPQKSQRILGIFPSYALVNSQGAVCKFYLPDEKGEWVDLGEFAVPPKEQGNWFRNLGWFKECWEVLTVDRGCLGLRSPCLITPVNAAPVKKEFRFEPVALDGEPDAWALLKLWMMAGAARPKHETDHRDMLYIATPLEATRLKAAQLAQGKPNPYRHLHHSIYDRELEGQLKR